MKKTLGMLFTMSILCIWLSFTFAASAEELLWTAKMYYLIDNRLQHEDRVVQYDYETDERHIFSIADKSLEESVIIDGQINGNSIIAAKIPAMNAYVIYEWSDDGLGKHLASFSREMRIDESSYKVTDILAWINGWTYLRLRLPNTGEIPPSDYFVRIKEDQYQLLGTQKYLDFDLAFGRAKVSDQGSIAYWDYHDDCYGIYFAQPIDDERVNAAFVPVFECKDKRWAFNNGQYYLPAMPIIWKDEKTILCFAVRTFSKSGVSYNDAYMIDTSSQAAMPYLAADGNQLSISNLVFGAGSVLMEEDELIVAAYHEPSCYWIGFEGTRLADAVFTLSLSTGQADLLTVDSEALSYNTDSIVVLGGSR